jgi:hypothetical protein
MERSTSQDSSGISLQQMDDRGSIIAGSMNSPVTGKKAVLIMTDSYGQELWIMPLNGPRKDNWHLSCRRNFFGAGAEDAWLVKFRPENALSASGNAVGT